MTYYAHLLDGADGFVLTKEEQIVVMTCPRNHPATSLYATKMADPQGSAVYGIHYGCEQCDTIDRPEGVVK